LRPGSSLSGRMATGRPARASPYSARHFPAPPTLVVASKVHEGVRVLLPLDHEDGRALRLVEQLG
jgi:hypothetical protein